MSLQKQFAEFNDKIRLTWNDNKLKLIREKDESIQTDIRSAFKDAGYPVVEFFQQGSYATQTCIEPLNNGDDYDIDVGVVIDKANAPDDPVEVKKTLRDVLEDRNLKNPKIKKPCVTAQYYKEGEKNFHLDYPIYSKDFLGSYLLAIGKEHASAEEKRWEAGAPKGLIEWLNDKSLCNNDNDRFAQYKRLIRYLKRWRDFVFSDSDRKKSIPSGCR
jgi:predicted nucleotidyltransferase